MRCFLRIVASRWFPPSHVAVSCRNLGRTLLCEQYTVLFSGPRSCLLHVLSWKRIYLCWRGRHADSHPTHQPKKNLRRRAAFNRMQRNTSLLGSGAEWGETKKALPAGQSDDLGLHDVGPPCRKPCDIEKEGELWIDGGEAGK